MMKLLMFFTITVLLTTGCGEFGQKLLGIEKQEPAPTAQVVYETGGQITGDYMVYGDPQFRPGKMITVEVCDQDETTCQALPYRTSVPKGVASYLIANGGIFINYVPSTLPGMRRWRAKIYA